MAAKVRGGLRPLIHPATRSDEIDVEGTRAERERINAAIRRDQELLEQLLIAPVPLPDA